MSGERSRPNWVAQKKYEAIEYWDQEARQRIREGKYVRGFGNWSMKQLAKAHSESWAGLALDIASLGSGGLLVKGVQSGARAIRGAKAVQTAKTIMEIERSLKPIREADGILRPLSSTSTRVLEGVGKAAGTIEKIAPKFVQPLTVAGQKIVAPRRALKAVSLIARGIKTEYNPSQMGGRSKPNVPRTSQPQFPPNKSAIDPWSKKPYKSVLEVGPNTPLNPKYHWVFPPEIVTHSRPFKTPFDTKENKSSLPRFPSPMQSSSSNFLRDLYESGSKSRISQSPPLAGYKMLPGTVYSDFYTKKSYRVDNFGNHVMTGSYTAQSPPANTLRNMWEKGNRSRPF